MKGSRILLALVVLAAMAAVFLLLRPRPAVEPAAPVSNRGAAAPKQETARPVPKPAPEPVDLGSVLGLDSLSDCTRGPVLDSVIEQMVRFDSVAAESRRGGPISVPGFDRPLVPTFERVREIEGNADIRAVTSDLDLPGRWHGLSVTGLRRSFYEESDVSYVQIRFAEPPERVREVLARHGFRLPPVEEMRDVAQEGMSVLLGVERIEGGAALTCATG